MTRSNKIALAIHGGAGEDSNTLNKKNMAPKGKLLIIGGEDICGGSGVEDSLKYQLKHLMILKDLLPKNKRVHHIEVLTTSMEIPGEIKTAYMNAFEKIGYSTIGFINILNKEEARKEEYENRIAMAGTILFCGSDQFCITSIIGGTTIEEIISEKYYHDEDFIMSGFNAGATAITRIMIVGGGKEETLVNRDLKTGLGLGWLKNCIIDTHFIKKGRFGRLAHAITMNPAELGIGLGEDAAIVILNGNIAICYGEGSVVMIDGKHITQTNIADEIHGAPVFVEGLKVHLLVKGCQFIFDERKLIQPVASTAKSYSSNIPG